MQPVLRILTAVLAAMLLTLASACQPMKHVFAPETAPGGTIAGDVARLVNDYRIARGCPRLIWDARLASIAEAHSLDMRSRDYFGHRDPEGRDLAERLTASGIPYSIAAENIARGYRHGYEDAARAVFEGWLKSRSHRAIIESCDFLTHGVGVVDDVWTHVFVR